MGHHVLVHVSGAEQLPALKADPVLFVVLAAGAFVVLGHLWVLLEHDSKRLQVDMQGRQVRAVFLGVHGEALYSLYFHRNCHYL